MKTNYSSVGNNMQLHLYLVRSNIVISSDMTWKQMAGP